MARKTVSQSAIRRAKPGPSGARKAGPQKSAQVRARIDPEIKQKAETILENLGLNPSSAISTFYRQIVMRKGLPFPIEVPNAATIESMEEARRGAEVIEGSDLQDLLSRLLSKKDRSIDLAELIASNPAALKALLGE